MSAHRTLCITVRGRISDRLAACFDGMRVEHRDHTTELVGPQADQAQLHGLLTRVRDLGLQLESVRVLDLPPASSDPESARPAPELLEEPT